ncbi:MAG: hypothetical protein M3N45_16330 [Actinomycetota bacterium]|nr:hypothetical protein [Actinomycetota bacterium]
MLVLIDGESDRLIELRINPPQGRQHIGGGHLSLQMVCHQFPQYLVLADYSRRWDALASPRIGVGSDAIAHLVVSDQHIWRYLMAEHQDQRAEHPRQRV